MLKKEKKETNLRSKIARIQMIRVKVVARLNRHGYRYDINTEH